MSEDAGRGHLGMQMPDALHVRELHDVHVHQVVRMPMKNRVGVIHLITVHPLVKDNLIGIGVNNVHVYFLDWRMQNVLQVASI